MANVITGYSESEVRELVYKRPRIMDEYLDRQLDDDGGQRRYSHRFLEKARGLRDRFRQSRAYRATLASARKLRNAGRRDAVTQLFNLGEMQHATPTMQRYVMSNPTLRRRWRDKRLAGYENGYNRDWQHVNAIEDTDTVYRVVMSGVARQTERGLVATTYHLSQEERRELTEAEKGDVRISWGNFERALWEGVDDPTSQYNHALG